MELPHIPYNIDGIVPISMNKLVDFASGLAPYWDRLAYSLCKAFDVQSLRECNESNHRKVLMILESWTKEDVPSWKTLLAVLDRQKLRGIESKIRRFLVSEVGRHQPTWLPN